MARAHSVHRTWPLLTGKLTVAPKRAATKRSHGDNQKLTKAINAENESHFAAMAAKGGGHLALVGRNYWHCVGRASWSL